MAGAELFLGALGAVIPALQAIISAKDRSAELKEVRIVAKEITDLHNDIGQQLFSAINSNLQLFKEVVEPKVDENDRVFAANIQRSIYKTVKKSQETAQELDRARNDQSSNREVLRALEDKLDRYGIYLNNFQLSMLTRLLLRQFQRLNGDGNVAFYQPSTYQSETASTSLRGDIRPIIVSYDADPQLEWPISKGDIAFLKQIFDSEEDDIEPTSRQSLALLLACRKRLPKIVKLCLDYSADPTVTGDDGLGAIHNAIGTADVIHEPPETIEILTMLIEQGVDPSARDSTKKGLRPLHRAAMTKNVSVTKLLLERNKNIVNVVDAEGKTALYHACETPNQKMELIDELVEKGADFASKSRPPMPDLGGQMIARFLDERGLN